jgi:hypothetical protein
MFRRFVLVLALGCSAEASPRMGTPVAGESMRTEADGDSRSQTVAPTVDPVDSETNATPPPSTLWVNHYQVPCSGWEGKYLCNLVADSEDGPWVMEYDAFGGVPLEWGHVYQVDLGFVDQGDGWQDAPRIATFVTDVRTDRSVDVGSASFEFRVDPRVGEVGRPYLTFTGADGGKLIDGTPFICSSRQVCDLLDTALAGDQPFVVRFGYGPALLPLVALSIDG